MCLDREGCSCMTNSNMHAEIFAEVGQVTFSFGYPRGWGGMGVFGEHQFNL